MATHTFEVGREYTKLQEEVNNILEGVHHLFDSFAEYAHEADPANVIDLDKILAKHKVETHAHMQKHIVHKPINHRQFPKNPVKIVNAMPVELQEEVKIYESNLSSNQRKQKTLLQHLFKRLEF